MRIPVLLCFPVLAVAQHGLNPVPKGFLHVRGNSLIDGAGRTIVLRGAEIPALDPADLAGPTLSATTFSTMRQRWNMNALRLPVSTHIADPQYLPRVAEVVRKANVAGLVVILAAYDGDGGLPQAGLADFWKLWAKHFAANPMVLFDVYNGPTASGQRDWRAWRDAMQPLVDTIRAASARQPVV